MIDTLLDMIQFSQLEVLGFTAEHGYLLLFVIILILLSFVLKPMMIMLIYKRFTFVLTYIIGSLMICIMSLLLTINDGDMFYIKIGMKSIIIFGLSLALYLFIKKFRGQAQS